MHWPFPRWDCNHRWKVVGIQYTTWTSAGTNDSPPPDAPRYAECVCMICGGYSDQAVSIATDRDGAATSERPKCPHANAIVQDTLPPVYFCLDCGTEWEGH